MPRTTRGLCRRLKLSGNRCGASDGRICCDGAVLVHVAGDAEVGQVADLGRAADRAAEDQDRQPAAVELADGAHQVDSARVRQPEVDHHQVDVRQVRPDPGQQFGRAPDGEGPVPGVLEGGLEPVAHERGIIGNHDGLVSRRPPLSFCASVSDWARRNLRPARSSLQPGSACRYNPGSRRDNRRRVSSYADAAGKAPGLERAAGPRAAR